MVATTVAAVVAEGGGGETDFAPTRKMHDAPMRMSELFREGGQQGERERCPQFFRRWEDCELMQALPSLCRLLGNLLMAGLFL